MVPSSNSSVDNAVIKYGSKQAPNLILQIPKDVNHDLLFRYILSRLLNNKPPAQARNFIIFLMV